MTVSAELSALASAISGVAPEQSHLLHRLVIQVRRMERFNDEVMQEARESEMAAMKVGSRGEIH